MNGRTALVLFALLWGGVLESATRATEKRYALLVGCTKYPYAEDLRELRGPSNDVSAWARVLTDPKGFAFTAGNVKQLVGWPDELERRPTLANITWAFENLIGKSGPGVQIVIVLCGHGVQVPIPADQKDPLDPTNPEPDGLDEVFLPADVRPGEERPEGILIDDQIGRWLDQMRDRGASVWIVFDSCYSGTMTRGSDAVEISRSADPAALGIRPEAIDLARRRGREAVQRAQARGEKPLQTSPEIQPKPGKGSLVAFYAAQSFEEAPELLLPDGAAACRENYFGLLSYSLIQCLEQRRSPITYRELGQMLSVHYRAARGARSPTPFGEGDLDREVLGLNVWPKRSEIVLKHARGNKLWVNVGELLGLTPGSVLAVHPPAGDERESKTLLGYVKVESVSPISAGVVPCEWSGAPAANPDKLPPLARCQIVSRDFGDLRLRLYADNPAVLAGLAPEVNTMLTIVASETNAHWILRSVTPPQAQAQFGIGGLGGDFLFLLQGKGRARDPEDGHTAAFNPTLRKVFGTYALADKQALADELQRDLPRIFKWQNLWRIADGVHADDGGETHHLIFEVAKLKDKDDRSGGELLRDGILRAGQAVEFRLKNEGFDDLWVTILYLDANLGIQQFYSGGIKQKKALRPFGATMTAEGNSTGLEGMVVFAIPMAIEKDEPDYRFLEQPPLQVSGSKRGGAERAPASPFGRLMEAALNAGGTRSSIKPRIPSTPAVLSQSWVLLP